MAYLALARKWRPRTFADVVGQPHVVRALTNALDSDRVHHAFLFTGTRGVGKTTIARILVKALNCERGASATPCGECGACVAIDSGRFVDFLEVDAASRTGVDDARQLLDNAQYLPASGRYKVYLIDEVHMLSKPAFNALLKTLEEPPAHVKFLLATTDPQKIPVTVLSRCLQFNLKRLPVALIAGRLGSIAAAEGITAEPAALERLARAAAGSLRDALSLMDQGLAFGNGALRDRDIAAMLGSLDRAQTTALLSAVAAGDAAALLATLRSLDELAPDYDDTLAQLATLLQQVAVAQLAGPGILAEEGDEAAGVLAGQIEPELVQLWYQIAIQGRRDLPLAPDARTGCEMTLLRMLAFRPLPAEAAGAGGTAPAGAGRPAAVPAAVRSSAQPAAAPKASAPGGTFATAAEISDWPAFVETLDMDGAARQLAANSALESATPFELRLVVLKRNAYLLTDNLRNRVVAAVQARLGPAVKVQFTLREQAAGDVDTAAGRAARSAEEEQARARAELAADPNVRQMEALFGARLVPESVRSTKRSPKDDSK
ncbi:MAG: DNA polymerase III subunit gamma/tau [Chromatiales bacterium]|jgi:DNA polymerase-3 subunit gamma/tau|nr:DNA polymerase III subunit gamma/tau [Chromatiales bacterium]